MTNKSILIRMKTRRFLFTLFMLFVSFTATAYEWTDANGTIWRFDLSDGYANLYNNRSACINGTIPNELTIPSTVAGGTAYTVRTIGDEAFSGNTETGIGSIENEIVKGKSSNGKSIYDLLGRCSSTLQQRINIISGKKVLIE